ncbi:long-chain-fatty-acid--CoA ligase ACSBG2-like isoform X3 [Dysidea avara]|uniref:long-chain-fatty-acid--CoA ligase ACSBG2-like isoform X3 n=1 Tax=Dysidea avara TaxID=196820 RepID=UPI00331F794D
MATLLAAVVLRDVKERESHLEKGAYGKLACVECAGMNYVAQGFKVDGGDDIGKIKKDLLEVCRVWGAVNNPKIVQLIGVWYRDGDSNSFPMIVMEEMQHMYSLRFLCESLTKTDCRGENFSKINLLSVLLDVALGLRYLHSFHSTPIVHCGITPDNILLQFSSCGHCACVQAVKIANVGVAKVMKLTDYGNLEKNAYLQFIPPEAKCTKPQQYEPSFDVFSFGTVCWYTAAKNSPELPVMSEDPNTMEKQRRDLQNSSNITLALADCKVLKSVVECCMSEIPTKRPSIKEVSETIKIIIKNQAAQTREDVKQRHFSEKLYCFDPAELVHIKKGETGIAAKEPMTVPEFYKRTFSMAPNKTALRWKDKDGLQESLTYEKYKEIIYNVAKSFKKLGLEPYHTVAVMGSNSVEWFASSIGAVFAGGMATGIYTTSNEETCHHILKDSKTNIVVVENSNLLSIILKIRERLPDLKAIVQYKEGLREYYSSTYTWTKFLELGEDMEDTVIENIINKQRPEQCAMLTYTSGTTGNPKGVMLSHDNLTWTTEALLDTIGSDIAEEVTKSAISYLPTAHISGMFVDMFLPVATGGTVCFANSSAIKGTLSAAMQECQPTFFFATPRVWERMKEKIEASLLEDQTSETSSQFSQATIGTTRIYEMIKKNFGLDKCKFMFVGADSMLPDTLRFFRKMRLTVLEVYGLSETAGPQTTNLKNIKKVGSCGSSINGVQTKIENATEYSELLHYKKPKNDIGEVVCHGRNVFMGYLGMEDKTKEAIKEEGWLHTGDIGYLDEDGCLHITCRDDDIITLHDGTKINPIEIEAAVKNEVDFLSNAMLIGDNREHLTCLLTLKCVVDPDTGEATDDLQPQVIKMFQELGTKCTTVSQVIETEDRAVFKDIQDGIDRYNDSPSLNNAQKILGWRLMPTDFTVFGRELGPTLKLRRLVVTQKYAEKIEDLYGNEPGFLFEKEQCHLADSISHSIKCTHYGHKVEIEEHNVTVIIPKGAVEKGHIAAIEVSASLFGSYKIPNGHSRISPYVSIGTEYDFKEHLIVEVEHHAVITKEQDITSLRIMEVQKGSRSGYQSYDDEMCEASSNYPGHCKIRSTVYTYKTKSKCTCVVKKTDSVAVPDYVIVRQFLPKNYAELDDFTIEICLCCNLKYLKKTIEDKYIKEDKIKDKENEEIIEIFDHQDVDLHLNKRQGNGWSISYSGHNSVSANKIIHQSCQDEHSPCFRIRVIRQSTFVQLYTTFEIHTHNQQGDQPKVLSTMTLLIQGAIQYHDNPSSREPHTPTEAESK